MNHVNGFPVRFAISTRRATLGVVDPCSHRCTVENETPSSTANDSALRNPASRLADLIRVPMVVT